MSAPDFIIREPSEAYHAKAGQYLSSHLLAHFRKSPRLYWRHVNNLAHDADQWRPAYIIGRAAHTLILEGREIFEAQYAVGGPVNPKTGEPFGPATKAVREWEKAHGKAVLTDDQYGLIMQLANAVAEQAEASKLLTAGTPEAVLRAPYHGMECQARIDWLRDDRDIVDLKTCEDLDYFEADARRYGYVHQMAFYQSVLWQCSHIKFPSSVSFVAVEKKEPYRCGVWPITSKLLDEKRRENEAAISRMGECVRLNRWPTGYEEPRIFCAA